MNEKPILMTQAQYARHRGKSPQYIGKLAKAGILVMRGRMVDAAASDAVRPPASSRRHSRKAGWRAMEPSPGFCQFPADRS